MQSYAGSLARLEESQKYLSGGVSSNLRAAMKPTPLYAKSARGAHLWDVDGHKYIDYLLAYGPLILGHAHPSFVDSLQQAIRQGITYGLQHDGEIALAQRITELVPTAEQVAFSNSGSEAVMVALRLARAYTGRSKIVRFHGHYHGWSDAIFTAFPSPDLAMANAALRQDDVLPGTAGQSESSLRDLILLRWNDAEALQRVIETHHHEIAAIITEPVMCNSGCIQPRPGYLEQMRRLTEEYGIVLIFDEVITGFRLGLGGAQEYFNIRPDLTTLGKALAGGVALSAVAGRASIMQLIATGKVNHLGTLNGNCAATAAALSTIEELSRDEGRALTEVERCARALADGIRGLLARHGLRGVVNQVGGVFHVMFIDAESVDDFDTFQRRDSQRYTGFAERLLSHGVLVRPNGLWYVSTAHDGRDIAQTLEAVDCALGDSGSSE